MLNVNELLKGLEVGEYGHELENYTPDTYISDATHEIADNHTSVYYADIIKFISENVEAVNDVILELGWDGVGADLYKAGQAAEYYSICNEINEHLEDALKNYSYKYYVAKTDSLEISEELNQEIVDTCENYPSQLYEITDIIDYYVEELENEQEVE